MEGDKLSLVLLLRSGTGRYSDGKLPIIRIPIFGIQSFFLSASDSSAVAILQEPVGRATGQ